MFEQCRPAATNLELDRAYQRARQGARRPRRASSGVIVGCLALGLLFSGTGTTLAISGLSSDGSAVVRQYPATPATPATPADQSGVQGVTTNGTAPTLGGNDTSGQPKDTSGVKGERTSGSTDTDTDTDTANDAFGARVSPGVEVARQRQATSTGKQLPFTGFAVVPLLLIGVALIATGLVLRRRSQTPPL